jgi:hypothetical protein
MKYMKTLASVLLAALFVTAATAATTNAPVAKADSTNQWTLSLSGGGSTSLNSGGNSAVGAEFELGRTYGITLPLLKSTELLYGVRQGIGWGDANGADWQFSTKVFSDVKLFTYKSFELDGGGNVGILYGNRTLDWVAAPEVVGRLYLKKDVDFFGRVEYPFDLNRGRAENSLVYTLGVRVKF